MHTPGPWYASGGDIFSNETERPAAYRRKVATVYNTPDVATEDRQGNAALIAAAPDLLEAAQDALDWYETSPISEVEAVEDAIQRTFPFKELTEAIRKADGLTSEALST